MKKLFPLYILVLGGIILAACQRDPDAPSDGHPDPKPYCTEVTVPINPGNCGQEATTALVAGKFTEVGYVRARMENGQLYVSYHVTQHDWRLTGIHLDVEGVYTDLPINGGGNPKIGHFEFNEDLAPGQFVWNSPGIDVSGLSQVEIAAHSEVTQVSPAMNPNPGEFTMDASVNDPSDNTYISVVLADKATNYTFAADTWCLDRGSPISNNALYDIILHKAVDLTDTDYNCLGIEHPENMDLVQYLINQTYSCANKYDLQVAVWRLINDNAPTAPTTALPFTESCVQTILADAYANGEGFLPDACFHNEGFVGDGYCDPSLSNQPEVQTLLVIRPPGCPYEEVVGGETAWACGTGFPGRSWAMYFTYCIQ